MEKKIELVVFDLDGTLIDTETSSIEMWEKACKEFGYEIEKSEVLSFIGKSKAGIGDNLKRRFGEGFPYDEVYNRKGDLSREFLRDNIALMPYVEETLEELKKLDIKMCVATSSAYERSVNYLKKLGVNNYFEFLVSGDEVARSKPFPDIFEECFKRMGVDPSKACVVEDSSNGIIAARESKATAVLIPDMVPVTKEMESNVHYIFKNLREFTQWIRSLKED